MNNLYKLLAFMCLVFATYSINAQAKLATVTADGLIILDASTPDVAAEYIADISRFGFQNPLQAQDYFRKYVEKTTNRGINYSFDLLNHRLYIFIDLNGQNIIPKAFVPTRVSDFNNVFRMIHLGQY